MRSFPDILTRAWKQVLPGSVLGDHVTFVVNEATPVPTPHRFLPFSFANHHSTIVSYTWTPHEMNDVPKQTLCIVTSRQTQHTSGCGIRNFKISEINWGYVTSGHKLTCTRYFGLAVYLFIYFFFFRLKQGRYSRNSRHEILLQNVGHNCLSFHWCTWKEQFWQRSGDRERLNKHIL